MQNHIMDARWLAPTEPSDKRCLEFFKDFKLDEDIESATLTASALGVYKAEINGKKVGDIALAPGRTSMRYTLMYQTYDITDLLKTKNHIVLTVAGGWKSLYPHEILFNPSLPSGECAVIASIDVEYSDGSTQTILTDCSWKMQYSKITMSDPYDGETYDATFVSPKPVDATPIMYPRCSLVPQINEPTREKEFLKAVKYIRTPAGEDIVDFGQNLAGFIEFSCCGEKGHVFELECGETLDKDGNFYRGNYRKAKAKLTYISDGKKAKYKTSMAFFGFRYLRLTGWNGKVDIRDFSAVAVYSDMERTGYIETSDPDLNRLYSNIIWGQRSNFVDVPTDCPQRDEKLGWTGDAQVFCKCASLNYNTYNFFRKWLNDMRNDQRPAGAIPQVIPNNANWASPASSWSDACCIIPWTLYLIYGNRQILEENFQMMKSWAEYIIRTDDEYFSSEKQYGDWLSTDIPDTSYMKGGTNRRYMAMCASVKTLEIVTKTAEVLNVRGADFTEDADRIRKKIVDEFFDGNYHLKENTQTAFVVAIDCRIWPEKNAEFAKELVRLIHENGDRISTGFVGTPYILHVLSSNGYSELAYTLLLQKKYPSWLYPLSKGATTMWEHWDGIKEDGSMWSDIMNSFNHYAYGAVGDWIYTVAAGINYDESEPGFRKITISPVTDSRISYLKASLITDYGLVSSEWKNEGKKTTYTIVIPDGTKASAIIEGKHHSLKPGTNTFVISR